MRRFIFGMCVLLSATFAPHFEAVAGPQINFRGINRGYETRLFRGYRTEGIASWYGPGFHGKQTASGQIFNMYRYTCASRSLPFGTRVLVTNLVNNKSVTCVTTDRGPYVGNRILDLAWAAARKIGITGIGRVRIRVL